MSNIPPIFASILAASKEDPLIKYRATYEGASAADVASIDQAQAFAPILRAEIVRRSLIIPEPILVAQQEGGNGTAKYFPVSAMIEDGFPAFKPIHLHFIFAKGEDMPEEEGDNGMSGITRKKNVNIIEVADAIRMWFTGEQQMVLNNITQTR